MGAGMKELGVRHPRQDVLQIFGISCKLMQILFLHLLLLLILPK
jgi:hypothetical protein